LRPVGVCRWIHSRAAKELEARLADIPHRNDVAMKCVSTLGLALAAWLAAVPPLAAQTIDISPNLAGLGVGVTPRYASAREDVWGAVPGIRYQVQGSRKFFEWYGPLASFSLTESERWQFGPSLGFRLGRSDVEDAVVRLL
jgi:MipA family protein